MIFADNIYILNKFAEAKLVSSHAIDLAEFLCKQEKNLSEEQIPVLALTVALLFEQVSSGSICLTKNEIKTFTKSNKDALSGIDFPDWNKISETLAGSYCCTKNPTSEAKPIILSGDRIYFYKYWLYENSLAAKVKELSGEEGSFANKKQEINTVFDKLFDENSSEQRKAAETVLENRISVITGGPGTGKTTTVAKIIAGILKICPESSIILSAPTGKAAARMTEALQSATKNIRKLNVIEEQIFEKMASLEGLTIHKILDKSFGKPKKNRKNPISADLIIIDEASMIDIVLFSEVTDALSDKTSLILLGDKDQLASVDAGNVFSDICSAAEEGLFERQIEAKLTKSYRFKEDSGIGRLAKAVNEQKNIGEVVTICNEEKDLCFSETSIIQKIAETAAENYRFLSDINLSQKEILERLNDFKILCPSKEDSFGVEKINSEIEKILKKNPTEAFYNGRPIMITKNDYTNNLMNGDCGVILKRNGKTRACFIQDNNVRSFDISELPVFETVYAMTIHKSQGSEYKSVLVVMPERNMPMLTKELLYTAITRAKEKVCIAGKRDVLEYTLSQSASRNSGFKEALVSNSDDTKFQD